MLYSVAMAEHLKLQDEKEFDSDEDILLASLSTPALFSRLVAKYQEPFLRKAKSIVHDEREAEDIVQETFLKIYLNARKFKVVEGAQFSSWGYRILINTALTHYTKRKREGATRAELDPEILELLPDSSVEQFKNKELSDEIASVLLKMPPLFASALTAFFIDGLPQEEIAAREGVSVGAIKTRVHRAKKEFQRLYKSITPNI
jgi:RNA polymerase sigma-70 factor (ECF subfamily)